jgi:type IV pilus assembly protein PilA
MKRLWLWGVVFALALGCQDGAKQEGKKEEAKAEAKAEPKAEAKAETKAEAKAEPGTDTGTEAGTDTGTDTGTVEPVVARKDVRDARKILGEMAKWLPAETLLFLFADLGALDPNELGMGLFTIPASFDLDPMTEELGAFLETRIGLNLTKIQWVAAAGSPEPEFFVLFLGGDFGELAGTEELPGGLKFRALEGEDAYLATIPGAAGLAVLPDKKSVEALSAVLQGEVPSLPGTPGLAMMEMLLERSGAPRGFVVAAQLTNEALREKLAKSLFGKLKGFVPPDGALLGAGKDILLLIHGQEASLEMIEGQITLMKAMAKAMLDQSLAGIDNVDVGQGAGLIVAKHLWPVLSEQLTPKRDGEYMSLGIQIPGGLGMVSVVGVLAAVAVPAFIKYMKKAKTSEAVSTLDQLYRGSVAHYAMERVAADGGVSACQLPPAAGPVPAAGTCCGAFGGADSDGDDRCDGDEAEWDAAFGSLKVPYPGSHYFTYELLPDPRSTEPAMILRATGDLDCDGVRSTFERYLVGQATPGGGCELEDRRAMYVENELE